VQSLPGFFLALLDRCLLFLFGELASQGFNGSSG
jgi:hypothetical protein